MQQVTVTREQELVIPKELAVQIGLAEGENLQIGIRRDSVVVLRKYLGVPSFSLFDENGRLSYETLKDDEGNFIIDFQYMHMIDAEWEDAFQVEVFKNATDVFIDEPASFLLITPLS
jgi:bifunctional DNA-binding transcriptional regulator/antitoxin component of YhaV-PrlF toxin-antitoxin module